MEKEYTANHFTYAELEENEVDLVKLGTGSPGAGPRRIRRGGAAATKKALDHM